MAVHAMSGGPIAVASTGERELDQVLAVIEKRSRGTIARSEARRPSEYERSTPEPVRQLVARIEDEADGNP